MTDVLIKRGKVDTDVHREKPCVDEGRDLGDASTSQGAPKKTLRIQRSKLSDLCKFTKLASDSVYFF